MADSLTHTEVKVRRRSGHDKSFKNILTSMVGTITPLAYKLLIPNSDFELKLPISAALPPLASDTFMRCALKVEAFAVPMRLCYGGVESWLTGEKIYSPNGSGGYSEARAKLPIFQVSPSDLSTIAAPGSLLDYLGIRGPVYDAVPTPEPLDLNIFPLLSYHRIYDDWYRNRKVQKPLFGRPSQIGGVSESLVLPCELPYVAYASRIAFRKGDQFINGSKLYELHQRNYGSDYFTEAFPTATFGNEQKVTIDSSSQFTIGALRMANAMESFELKNNIASPQLQDYCLVHYGAHLSSGVAQRSIFLGSASYDVYSKGIAAQSTTTPTNNPFGSVGARYGNAFAVGTDFVCKGHVDEPCYLMVLATLVPEANYSTGLKHDLMIFTQDGDITDLPNPDFELVGNEPIYSVELGATGAVADYHEEVFGWQKRYQWHKSSLNEVHGLLVEGQSLSSFVAQRSLFASVLGNDFLQISKDDLDNVTAVTGDLSLYGVWIDAFVNLKVVEPLGESSLPSLVDPALEHGDSVYVRNNGSRIS